MRGGKCFGNYPCVGVDGGKELAHACSSTNPLRSFWVVVVGQTLGTKQQAAAQAKQEEEEADEEDAPMTSPAGKGKVSLLFVAFRNVFLPTVWLVADRKHERFLRDDEFETLFFVILAPL